jgi:hypothetical protein
MLCDLAVGGCKSSCRISTKATEFNMPNTLGCVDGTFIPIKAPSKREEAYVCRTSFHTLNVQGVCDHKKKFTNIVILK